MNEKSDNRERIVEAAAGLLRDVGPAAVTTRGVAQAAGVQAPAIYRLFGDKDGLLEAVAEHVMAAYVSAKAAVVEAASASDVDPLVDLRAGWTAQIEFGVANPAIFRLLSDPDRARDSPAARSGREVLRSRIHRVAAGGRLRVGEPHAVELVHAAGIGAIHVLLATPPERRDPQLADSMYDAVMGQILSDVPVRQAGAVSALTVAFRAVSSELSTLSDGEQALLAEWLDREIAVL